MERTTEEILQHRRDCMDQLQRELSKGFTKNWVGYLGKFQEYSDRHGGETPLNRMQWFDNCSKILDIGCGIGHAMMELKSKGKDVTGVDITPDNVIVAAGRGLNVTVADMHYLPFVDGTFDGVMMWDVFEHSLAPLVTLFECNRVLKSGGHLLIYIPPEHWDEHPVHVIIYTPRQIELLFKKAGFTLQVTVEDTNRGKQYHVVKS